MSEDGARKVVTEYLRRFTVMASDPGAPPAYLMFDPDCRFEVAGSLPVSGEYHGLEAVARDCMQLLRDRLVSKPGHGWYLERFIGEGDRVVALLRSRSASLDGRPYCGSYFVVFQVEHGRITHQLEILDTSLFMDCVYDAQLFPAGVEIATDR